MNETLGTSTGPSRVETDAGPAYAKLMGNPEGPQALFCEVVGTRAAQWLGLPTFEIGIVEVTEAGLVEFSNGSRSQAGPAFVTRYVDGMVWGGDADELKVVENPDALAGLIVLDTWLLNCDRFRHEGKVRRNTRNVFLAASQAKGKVRVMAIDHTHIFTCGHTLTSAIKNIDRTKDERLYGHFPEFSAFVTYRALSSYARRLRALQQPDVEAFFAGIPAPWRPTTEVLSAVKDFLRQRATFVGENVRQMLVDTAYLDPELQLEGDDDP